MVLQVFIREVVERSDIMLIKPSQDTFYVIYDSIVKEYNLTPVDILVYSIIRSYCDSNDNKGYYGSIQSLAERKKMI